MTSNSRHREVLVTINQPSSADGAEDALGSGQAEIVYAGVSLLDFDDSGKISRFATYFDTQAFDLPATAP